MDYSVPVKQPNCDVCFEFFDRFIRISSIARAALAPDTSTQDNQIWTDARKIRITSSRANAVPKTERGNPDVFIKSHLQPRFKGNRATQHGILNEDRAREQFQLTSGSIVVELCGTVVDSDDMWLSASPDGLVGPNATLEIKCHTKKLDSLIKSGRYDVFQISDGQYCLKENGPNGYFTQVQIALHCTKREHCSVYIWSEAMAVVCHVKYNAQFIEKILPRLRKFYFQNLLPRAVEECQNERLTLCEEYEQLCKC